MLAVLGPRHTALAPPQPSHARIGTHMTCTHMCTPVLRAGVVALPVELRGVVLRPEHVQELLVADGRLVIHLEYTKQWPKWL